MSNYYKIGVIGVEHEMAPFIDVVIVSVQPNEVHARVRNLTGQEIESVVLRLMFGDKCVGERVARFENRLDAYVLFTSSDVCKMPEPERQLRKIPARIWQTTSLKYMSPAMMGAIRSITDRNPAYSHKLFLDSECEEVLRTNFGPRVLEAYHTLKPGAFKADLWRYCMLYVHGGVYIDCKMVSKMPLDSAIAPDTDLLLVFSPIQCIHNMGFTPLYSALIAAVPAHPYIKACIETTVSNVLARSMPEGNILGITGPNMMFDVLKEMLRESPSTFANLKILEHTNNNSSKPHMFTVSDPLTNKILLYKQFPGYYEKVAGDHYTFRQMDVYVS